MENFDVIEVVNVLALFELRLNVFLQASLQQV